MSVPVRDYLRSTRDRVLGSIMGHAEREFFSKLTREQQRAFRQCVLDALNLYHDRILDLVKSDDGVINDETVDLLRRLDAHLARAAQTRP